MMIKLNTKVISKRDQADMKLIILDTLRAAHHKKVSFFMTVMLKAGRLN